MKNRKSAFRCIAVMLMLAILISVVAVSVAANGELPPASGYAAVGIVDAEAHKAEVLLGTGEQGTVYYHGAAPAAGAVYRYTRDDNNLYTFSAPSANGGHCNQLNDTGWNMWYTPNGWLWPGNGQIFFPDSNPIFVRFGNDGWALTTIYDFADTNGQVWVYSYMLDVTVRDADNNYWSAPAIVVGGYNNGNIDTTGYDTTFPSLEATNSLAAFTTALHANANTDAIILETGYAAIGAVDTDNSYVEILKGTGEQGYVICEGAAPVSGGVYRYSRRIDNVYTFTESVANHGHSSTTDPSKAAWAMWMASGYMWDAAPNHYWPGATTPFFVHTGPTTWIVTDLSCLIGDTGTYRATYQLDVALQAGSSSYYDTQAVVFGGLNADGTVDTTGIDALTLSETGHDLSALTNPLHTLPEPPAEEPTEPAEEPTEPADGGYTASGVVVERGYAAIGAVDTASGKAAVLLGNGKRGSVCFAGAAPKSDTVCGYERHDNNVYVFIEKKGNFENSDQLAAGHAWNMWFTPNGWAWDANQPNDIFYAPTPTPIFLRYGRNLWALITIEKVAETNGSAWAFGYALDPVHQPDLDTQNNLRNFFIGALVMGNMNADGTIDTTGFTELFGNPERIDLSTIADVPMNVPPVTGDSSRIGAVTVAMLLSAAAMVAVIKKKDN